MKTKTTIMITKRQIRTAANYVTNERLGRSTPFNNPIIPQLINSLKVYKGRGEFDGTIGSAVECLRQAGYQVPSEEPDHTHEFELGSVEWAECGKQDVNVYLSCKHCNKRTFKTFFLSESEWED